MLKHCNIKIYGRVQLVLFRDSARRKAKGLSLAGFVRNEPDGSVYIEAEGEEGNLEKFIKWCHKGPILASVKNVKIKESPHIKGFSEFEMIL